MTEGSTLGTVGSSSNIFLGAVVTDSATGSCSGCGTSTALTDGNPSTAYSVPNVTGSFSIFLSSSQTIQKVKYFAKNSVAGDIDFEIRTSTNPSAGVSTFVSRLRRVVYVDVDTPVEFNLPAPISGVRVVQIVIHSAPANIGAYEIQGFSSPTSIGNATKDSVCSSTLEFSNGEIPPDWSNSLGTLTHGRLESAGAMVHTTGSELLHGVKNAKFELLLDLSQPTSPNNHGVIISAWASSTIQFVAWVYAYPNGLYLAVGDQNYGSGGQVIYFGTIPYSPGPSIVQVSFMPTITVFNIKNITDATQVTQTINNPNGFVLSGISTIRYELNSLNSLTTWMDDLKVGCSMH